MKHKLFRLFFIIITSITLVSLNNIDASNVPNDNVATLSGKVIINNNIVYTGMAFNVDLQLNSESTGSESNDAIKDYTIDFTLPKGVTLSYIKNDGLYTITPTYPKDGDVIKITFKDDVDIAQFMKIRLNLQFEPGVRANPITFKPLFNLSASNANSTSITTNAITISNNPINETLSVDTDELSPIFLHNTFIYLYPEDKIGGLNHFDSKVTVTFPIDAQIKYVSYKETNYPVIDNGVNKIAIIDISTLNVTDGIQKITLFYNYPQLVSPGTKDYEIKVSYDTIRNGLNQEIHKEAFIKEQVVYRNGGNITNENFNIGATKFVYRTVDQPFNFDINFAPIDDLKNASIMENPVRGGETDFHKATTYDTITWQARPGIETAYNKGIETTLYYELNSQVGTWIKASDALVNGTYDFKKLNLNNDYVSKIKFDFTYDGNHEVSPRAGMVNIKIYNKTNSDVIDTTASYKDGIRNFVYLTGESKNINETTYKPIQNDGINNVHGTITKFESGGADLKIRNNITPIIANLDTRILFYGLAQNYGDPLYDMVEYVVIPKKVKIKSFRFNSPSKKATYEIKDTDPNFYTLIISYNNDLTKEDYGSGGQSFYTMFVQAQPGIAEKFAIQTYTTSKNPNQLYKNKTYDLYVENIGIVNMPPAFRGYSTVNMDLGLDISSNLKSSVNDTDYLQSVNTIADSNDKKASYQINIKNNSSTINGLDQAKLILMLPQPNDTMVISNTRKKSTIQPLINSITNDKDNTPLNSTSYDLYYSNDATSDTNKAELSDFSNVTATWIVWDGTTTLPTSAKALKIIKKDGLTYSENINLKLNVTLPANLKGTNVAWLSSSLGASYDEGNGIEYISIGEPNKTGIYVSEKAADQSIKGMIWEDENGNGLYETNEKLLNDNIVLTLYDWNNDYVSDTTLTNGKYEFNNLISGKYSIKFEKDISYKITNYKAGLNKDIDNNFLNNDIDDNLLNATVDLDNETSPLNVSAGLYKYGSIGDYVWLDADGNGIQGVSESGVEKITLHLYKLDNEGKYNFETSTLTSNNGYYNFNNLTPGTYKITFINTENYLPTLINAGTNNNSSKLDSTLETSKVVINSNQNDNNVDLGIIKIAQLGKISFKKVDASNNVLSGAEFGIWSANADLDQDLPITKISSNNLGIVTFIDLALGSYKIKETKAPVGYVLNQTIFNTSLNSTNLNIDLGSITNSLIKGKISLTKVDESGLPLENATFGLYSKNADISVDTPILTATSNDLGVVTFSKLDINEYKIKEISAPIGYHLNTTIKNAALTYTNNQIDLGSIINESQSKLEGNISIDVNGNDVYDKNETLLKNIKVSLFDDKDILITDTLTDDKGHYKFDSLYKKEYHLSFDLPNNHELSIVNEGQDKTTDNNYILKDTKAFVSVNLSSEPFPLNIDASMYEYASIGDYVWLDTNKDGIQDATEKGVNKSKMDLYMIENNKEVFVTSTISDANGIYLFNKLKPAIYLVKPNSLEGYQVTKNINTFNKRSFDNKYTSSNTTIQSGNSNLDLDLGLIEEPKTIIDKKPITDKIPKTGINITHIIITFMLCIGTTTLYYKQRYLNNL